MGGRGGNEDGEHRGRPGASRSDDPPLRRVVSEVAFEIASTSEGRAAHLSVEVWPSEGVWLRARSGRELRLLLAERDGAWIMRWERVEGPPDAPAVHGGELGPANSLTAEQLRTFIGLWLCAKPSQTEDP
ncbi:MAG: hypothetical protein AAGF11_25315 [Myxococcota bacterium]